MNTKQPWDGTPFQEIRKGASFNEIIKFGRLDWEVKRCVLKSETGALILKHFSIERDTDKFVFDVVGPSYTPVQNTVAIRRFMDICEEGYMTITTIGQLDNGRRIWVLAKMKETFSVGEEEVQGYMLMSHSHEYGRGTNFYLMPYMQASSSTIVLPLSGAKSRSRMLHGGAEEKFTTSEVFNAAKTKFLEFAGQTKCMVNTLMAEDSVREYAMKLFYPAISDWRVIKEQAQKMLDVYFQHSHQGSRWDAFQSVCAMIDHKTGINREFSLMSNWFGPRAIIKNRALERGVI